MKKIITVLSVVALVLIVTTGYVISSSLNSSDRGWLGVSMQSVDQDVVEAFGLSVKYGAIVNDVMNDSPAERAGIQDDDVIIALNGEKITDAEDLTDLIDDINAGDTVEVTVVRGYNTLTLKAVLEERPSGCNLSTHKIFRNNNFDFHDFGTYGYIGVKLVDLTDQLGEYFGIKDGHGALIMSVEEDSPAKSAGLKAGDVIVAVDSDEVFDSGDVSEIIGDMNKGDEVEVKVVRKNHETKFKLTVAETDDQRTNRFWGPDIGLMMPHHSGRYFHRSDINRDESDSDSDYDTDEYAFESDDLDELRDNLRKMKIDLKRNGWDTSKDVNQFRLDNKRFRDEMKELKDELEQMKDELRHDLREIRDRLD